MESAQFFDARRAVYLKGSNWSALSARIIGRMTDAFLIGWQGGSIAGKDRDRASKRWYQGHSARMMAWFRGIARECELEILLRFKLGAARLEDVRNWPGRRAARQG